MPDLFGVAISPFELQEWLDATHIDPDMCMVFEAWSRQRSLVDTFAKARAMGHDSILVTWEPWDPTKPGLTNNEQGELQARWSNVSILRGDHDAYIDSMARAMRDSGLTVYLRYAHEMNGDWYPWHNTATTYVEVWKYLRNRMRSMRGAWNVKFVWSPNPDLWRPTAADWLTRLLPYWPGPSQVDYIGFTMIEFGRKGGDPYSVGEFQKRFKLIREIFEKPVITPEVNVARSEAIDWLGNLAGWVRSSAESPPAIVLSQGLSRAQAAGDTGDLSWSAMDDPEALEAVRRLVDALHRT